MTPDYPNGVTGQMMEAGAEALMRARYAGVAINVGTDQPKVLDTASAIGCALARAFPAMLDKMEGGSRDTLLHPGPLGGEDPTAWAAMTAAHRAEYVLHRAPAHLLGLAGVLCMQRMGNPGFDAGSAFLAEAITGLARQMERAATIQRREQEQRRVALAAEAERVRAARPKRVRKPAKKKKGGAS